MREHEAMCLGPEMAILLEAVQGGPIVDASDVGHEATDLPHDEVEPGLVARHRPTDEPRAGFELLEEITVTIEIIEARPDIGSWISHEVEDLRVVMFLEDGGQDPGEEEIAVDRD